MKQIPTQYAAELADQKSKCGLPLTLDQHEKLMRSATYADRARERKLAERAAERKAARAARALEKKAKGK